MYFNAKNCDKYLSASLELEKTFSFYYNSKFSLVANTCCCIQTQQASPCTCLYSTLLSFTLSIPSLYIYITNCTNNITNSNTIPRPPLPHTSPHTCSTSSSIFITFFTFFFTLVYISFSLVLVCFSQRYLFVLFCFLFLFLYLLHTSTIPLFQTILRYTTNTTTNILHQIQLPIQ